MKKRWLAIGVTGVLLLVGVLVWFLGLREEARIDPNILLEELYKIWPRPSLNTQFGISNAGR